MNKESERGEKGICPVCSFVGAFQEKFPHSGAMYNCICTCCGKGKRKDFEILLIDNFFDVLTKKQKKDKVKNLLQLLRLSGVISLELGEWKLT